SAPTTRTTPCSRRTTSRSCRAGSRSRTSAARSSRGGWAGPSARTRPSSSSRATCCAPTWRSAPTSPSSPRSSSSCCSRRDRTTTDKVGFGAPEVYPGFTESSPTNSLQLNTNYTKVVSSNVVNETQFSWVRPYGILENHHADIPGISVSGIQGYQVGWGPNIFVQNSFNWSDVVTWTRGAHSMKFGGGYTREHADNDSAR